MCSGQLVVAVNSGLPMIVAGTPAVTVGLSSLGRLFIVTGVALIVGGVGALVLTARTHRQLTREFE